MKEQIKNFLFSGPLFGGGGGGGAGEKKICTPTIMDVSDFHKKS